MIYYAAREIDEHYLFAKEIAELAFRQYGVASITGKPHYKMVKAMLDAYARDKSYEKLFYQTKNGLCRVYQTDIVGRVLGGMTEPVTVKKRGPYRMYVAGKWWKYRLVGYSE